MTRKLLVAIFSMTLTASAFGYGIGYSTHPLTLDKKVVSMEATGITSGNGGVGIQARYTHKIKESVNMDAGIGMGGGDRSSRVFMGMDLELFPDYQNQPRISLKGMLENAKVGEMRLNTISVAPTVSKGFSFWGKEAFPYVAIPFGVMLNDDTQTYETSLNLSLGATAPMPFEGMRNLTAQFETTVDIKDSFTAVFLGLSYPIN